MQRQRMGKQPAPRSLTNACESGLRRVERKQLYLRSAPSNVRAAGDIDGLFVESELDLEGDQPDDSATQ